MIQRLRHWLHLDLAQVELRDELKAARQERRQADQFDVWSKTFDEVERVQGVIEGRKR